ncbi:MAG TPA: nuclear transport factor 2 family protein [Xanthobacteraceae bacterium]|nr:nuclear transport factor 2 family protein [Xanthobacteraceae bacterium]
MDTRASIEAVLDRAYEARRRNDAEASAACFCDNGCFMANGVPDSTKNRSEQVVALKRLFEEFALVEFTQHCRVIDPPRAVVHWRGKFRAKNGRVGDTDITDLIEVRDGHIASLTTFFDTAYAMNLAAPA